MKNLFLLTVFLLLSTNFYAQNNWEINFNHRHQPKLNKGNRDFISNENIMIQANLTVLKNWHIGKKLTIQNGIGFSREQVLGYVGVNHCWSPHFNCQSICTRVAVTQKNYTTYAFEIPLKISYRLNEAFSLGVNGVPQFRFFENGTYNSGGRFLFEIHGIEIYPEIIYHYDDEYHFSLGYRVFNVKKPDEIFFYNCEIYANHPDFYDKTLFNYNTTRLSFGVGYTF